MSYTFQFLLRAQEEYESSIKWYLSKSDSAAENFVAAVDNALFLICLNPHMWRNTYKVFYELGLKKFPFSVVDTIDDTRKRLWSQACFTNEETTKENIVYRINFILGLNSKAARIFSISSPFTSYTTVQTTKQREAVEGR